MGFFDAYKKARVWAGILFITIAMFILSLLFGYSINKAVESSASWLVIAVIIAPVVDYLAIRKLKKEGALAEKR